MLVKNVLRRDMKERIDKQISTRFYVKKIIFKFW